MQGPLGMIYWSKAVTCSHCPRHKVVIVLNSILYRDLKNIIVYNNTSRTYGFLDCGRTKLQVINNKTFYELYTILRNSPMNYLFRIKSFGSFRDLYLRFVFKINYVMTIPHGK